MGTATRERVIDGHRYAVTQLPAMRALRLLNRLGRVAGPGFAKLASAQAVPGALIDAAREVFDRLPDDELEAMAQELLSTALVDGKELLPQVDLHFQGRIGALFQVLRFALEANYGDFFGDLVRLGKSIRTASPSAESTTSSGQHGA